MPIIYYWKVIKDKPLLSKEKILALSVAIIIIIISIMGMINFIIQKATSD